MDKSAIETAAHDLHTEIWRHRFTLGFDGLRHPSVLLEPSIAATLLGIEYSPYEELGRFGYREDKFEIAGLIDRQAKRIAVSKKFSPEIIRFTGAHEIGHWLLHPQQILHRDRPIKGLSTEISRRNVNEQEADYFAACFLMPQKLVQSAIENTFKTSVPFKFDHDTAFLLCPSDPECLLYPTGDLDRALAIASVESYQGRHFHSLAKQFRVSSTTMAIRLKELGFIDN